MRSFKFKKRMLSHDKVATSIARFFSAIQTRFAEVMNRWSSHIPAKRLKKLLILFCLLWGGLSTYFIMHSIMGSLQSHFKVDPIEFLHHTDTPGYEVMTDEVDEGTYLQILTYRRYMDSLQQPIRPGLLDSMNLLEQIFLSQQSKHYER